MSLHLHIEKRKEDIYFIELNKDLVLKNTTVHKGLDLPVDQEALSTAVKDDQEGFDFRGILQDVCLVIGLDPDFAHYTTYVDLVKGMLENPFQYAMGLGIAASEKGAWIDAMSFYKAAIVFEPGHIDGYFNLGKAYYAMAQALEDVPEAMKLSKAAFDHAYSIEKKPEILYYLAFIEYQFESYITCKNLAQEALNSNVHEAYAQDLISKMPLFEDKALYEVGFKCILDERYQEGLEALLAISEHTEDDWRIQFFIGLGYRGLMMLPEAMQHLNKAKDLNPVEDRIYNEMGIVLMLAGDVDQAKRVLMEGLKFKPLNHEILCNLAIAHVELAEYALAKKFIDQAYEVDHEDVIVLQTKDYIEKLIDQGGLDHDA